MEIIVNKNKLENIKKEIDSLLFQNENNNEKSQSETDIIVGKNIDTEYELNKLEEAILIYIYENPGANKEQVVKNLTSQRISSRATIMKKIEHLQKIGYIITKKDEKNSKYYKLYYNDQNILYSLIRNLTEFKECYFILLENISDDLAELNKKSQKNLKWIDEGKEKNDINGSTANLTQLTKNIMLPFKTLSQILISSNFISFTEYNQHIILRKFTVINNFNKEIFIKLTEIFPNDIEREVDRENSVIHGLELDILPSSIENNINFFKYYDMKEKTEDVWEAVWKIISPFMNRLFIFYLHIDTIIKHNNVDSLQKLLQIKDQYKEIENHYH